MKSVSKGKIECRIVGFDIDEKKKTLIVKAETKGVNKKNDKFVEFEAYIDLADMVRE